MIIALIIISSILFAGAIAVIVMTCGVTRMERRREENETRWESEEDDE